MSNIYLVRHGDYDETGGLNSSGVRQAEKARDYLLGLNLKSPVVIIGSTAKRATETAEIIADGFDQKVIPSETVKKCGFEPESIKVFENFVEKILHETGVGEPEAIIIVAHQPMLLTAKIYGNPREYSDVHYGEVYKYTPGTWK